MSVLVPSQVSQRTLTACEYQVPSEWIQHLHLITNKQRTGTVSNGEGFTTTRKPQIHASTPDQSRIPEIFEKNLPFANIKWSWPEVSCVSLVPVIDVRSQLHLLHLNDRRSYSSPSQPDAPLKATLDGESESKRQAGRNNAPTISWEDRIEMSKKSRSTSKVTLLPFHD